MGVKSQGRFTCQHCGEDTAYLIFGKYCHFCRRFELRHGRLPKPEERKVHRYGWVPCKVCKQKRSHAHGRCVACAAYFRKHGVERPKERWWPNCLNCGIELERLQPDSNHHGRGLCKLCHKYQMVYGKPRPQRLWKPQCACGRVAKHTVKFRQYVAVREMHLCDECHAEWQRQIKWYGGDKDNHKEVGR